MFWFCLVFLFFFPSCTAIDQRTVLHAGPSYTQTRRPDYLVVVVVVYFLLSLCTTPEKPQLGKIHPVYVSTAAAGLAVLVCCVTVVLLSRKKPSSRSNSSSSSFSFSNHARLAAGAGKK